MVFARQYSKRSLTVATPAVKREVPASVKCSVQGKDILALHVSSHMIIPELPRGLYISERCGFSPLVRRAGPAGAARGALSEHP